MRKGAKNGPLSAGVSEGTFLDGVKKGSTMIKETVLQSGTRIVTESIPEFRSCTLGAWVSTGSRFESEQDAGLAHFLEHLLFKGTRNRTAYDIAKEMDSIGGQLNAFTDKETTCFYARVLDQHIDRAADVLFDMLKNSLLDPVEVEREKGVIIEEIKMFEDSPDDQSLHRFQRSIWGAHPLGRPVIGYREVIEQMTSERLSEYLSARYGASNLMVAAAGRVDHDAFVDTVSRALEDYPQGSFSGDKGDPVPVKQDLVFHKDCEQTYLCYGGPGLSAVDSRRYSFLVLDAVLGGSMSSRLFQEIREARGLAYSVGTFLHSYQDCGAFGIYAGTSGQSLEQLLDVADTILKDTIDHGLSDEELGRSKELLKGNLALGLESTSSRMLRMARSHLVHGRMIEVEEVIRAVERTTHREIRDLAAEYLDPSRFSLSVLGPVGTVRGIAARPVSSRDLTAEGLLVEVGS
jgi:predicted Zn-dependent peptidase